MLILKKNFNFRDESDDITYIEPLVGDYEEDDRADYENQNDSRTDFEKGLKKDSGISKLTLFCILIGVGAAILIIMIIYICICCFKK